MNISTGFFRRGIQAAILAGVLLLPGLLHAEGYVVVASKDVEVNSLSKAELQAIFLGEKVKWNRAKYIKIALLEEGPVMKEFLQGVLGKTPAQFETHWSRLIFTGKASTLPRFPDSAKVVDFVAGKAGAIGVVAADQAGSSVKIIQVQ
jgi:ABC-type phosphate transport system substrate-binding protein